jgi:hypothetical protein
MDTCIAFLFLVPPLATGVISRAGMLRTTVSFSGPDARHTLDLAGADKNFSEAALRKWYHNRTLAPYAG